MKTVEVSISDLPNYHPEIQDVYSVSFDGEQIRTVVAKDASTVEHWINTIYSYYREFLRHLIIGLDVEWKPSYGRQSNPVATLQLCVGCKCLIFQLKHADEIPESLHEFLSDPDFTFVGVGIGSDVDKLKGDYDLRVRNFVDLSYLAAEKYGRKELKNVGLMRLAEVVLGCGEIDKPRSVTLSNWDLYRLTQPQIKYACVDAYVSFKVGKQLLKRYGGTR